MKRRYTSQLVGCLLGKLVLVALVVSQKMQGAQALQEFLVKTEKTGWVHEYQHIFSDEELRMYRYAREFLSEQVLTPDFTQLIFSWNGYRHKKGHFVFSVGVQDRQTGMWDWHTLVEWGVEKQRSFFSRGKYSVFKYARLEMNDGRVGSAFQIKVEAFDALSLDQLKGLFVVTSNFTVFNPETSKEVYNLGLPSYKVLQATPKSQIRIDHPRANALCSPTSMAMVVQALKKEPIDELAFANHVYDAGLDVFGNWAFNMAHAFEYFHDDASDTRMYFYATRLNSFKDLYSLLVRKTPIAVSVRGVLRGAFKSYNNGHLLVVIGWDAARKKVICFDPRFETETEVEREYDLADFLLAWERSHRLTYKFIRV